MRIRNLFNWSARKWQHFTLLLNVQRHRMRDGIKIGKGTTVWPGARLVRHTGTITIGNNCEIYPGSVIDAQTGSVEIGDYCSLNPFALINGVKSVRIGSHCRIATQAVIVSGNHGFSANELIRTQPISGKGIVIGEDVWIAANAVILDGCVVPDGVVVAAGCVLVPKLMQKNGIYAGVPSQKIGDRKS